VKSKTGFQLPPDVSFEKQRLSNAWAYVFRHRLLGEVGRILLQELDDGRCHISCEVVGDPSDPMTTQRAAIFKPLGLELTRQMEAVMGRTREDAGSVGPRETTVLVVSLTSRRFLSVWAVCVPLECSRCLVGSPGR